MIKIKIKPHRLGGSTVFTIPKLWLKSFDREFEKFEVTIDGETLSVRPIFEGQKEDIDRDADHGR